MEIEEALAGPASVIPILINGAKHPSAEDLPSSVKGLSDLVAKPLRTSDFQDDSRKIAVQAVSIIAEKRRMRSLVAKKLAFTVGDSTPKQNPSTLPLLPDKILVGLQHDSLHYMNQLKYILLFFDHPKLLMARPDGIFLDEEAFDNLQRAKQARTSVWTGKNEGLLHPGVFEHEEWGELFKQCEPIYTTLNLEHSSQTSTQAEIIKENLGGHFDDRIVEELCISNKIDLSRLSADGLTKLELGEWAAAIGFRIIHDAIEHCRNEEIPMMWPDDEHRSLAELYFRKIVNHSECREEINARMRIAKGGSLLRGIQSLASVPMADVPINNILAFRRSHRELLETFLVQYRGFLSEVELEPNDARKITARWEQTIAATLVELQHEVAELRQTSWVKWFSKFSQPFADAVKFGVSLADWNLVGNQASLAMSSSEAQDAEIKRKLLSGRGLRKAELERLKSNRFSYVWLARTAFSSEVDGSQR